RTLLCLFSPHPVPSTLSLHDALPIYLDELVEFECVLHRQLARDGFDEAPDDHRHRLRLGQSPRLEVEQLLLRDARDGRLVAELRSEEHTSELQSRENLVCRLLLEKKK